MCERGLKTNYYRLLNQYIKMETIKNKSFVEVKEILKSGFLVKEDQNLRSLYLVTSQRDAETMPEVAPEFQIFQRGIILEKETNKPIFVGFKEHVEFDEAKPDLSNYGLEWSNCQIEESVEGSQIKLFFYQDSWRVATSHCIDASRSRWNGNNFYELFEDAAKYEKWDFKNLDTKYCHLLVLQHPKNVLITEFKEPKLIHILSRDMSQPEMPEVNLDLGLSKPNIISRFAKMEELLAELQRPMDYENIKPIECEGYIIHDTKTGRRMKILSRDYTERRELRMNFSSNNNIYHYLKLREKDKVYDYLSLYMKDGPIFRELESKLNDMIKAIYQQYIRKFKTKQIKMNDVFYQFRPIVYELNGIYLATRKPIRFCDVSTTLYKKSPEKIAYMYNLYYKGPPKVYKKDTEVTKNDDKVEMTENEIDREIGPILTEGEK